MAQVHITPRGVAPYVIGGATGVHVLARMHRLSRQPATDTSLYFFLLRNTDAEELFRRTQRRRKPLCRTDSDSECDLSESAAPFAYLRGGGRCGGA